MRRNYKILLLVVALSLAFWGFMPKAKVVDPEKDKLLLELLTFVVQRGHYDPIEINDEFSKSLYKEYMLALDPSKRFFLQEDIDEFAKYELQLDDQIKNRELTFFDLSYSKLMKRIKESESYYKSILDKPFDYNIDENFNTDYEKLPYAKNTTELKEKWRKQIKLSTLSSLSSKLELQEKGKDPAQRDSIAKKLKKKEKDLVDIESKTFEELEIETRKNSLKSLDEYFSFVEDLNRNDWFAVYVNSIASRFDPHTSYFAPDDKERFDVSMSGKLEGIGARLQKKNDYTEITDLISGGPAWRQKELEPGDQILKVAQGNSEAVDVVGMRLDDVVKKIKGPKGTVVKLSVKKADGTLKVISIVRDEVEIEETYAKSSVVEKDGVKYGIIYLPKFYINFEDRNGRDASKDMTLEVERLKTAGVKGIVIDVRDNGGGSLKTVVDIAGLFIEEGPIVQVKSANRKKEVLSDTDKKIQWDGPLVIMVNSFSASASEILAAALQDYHRAVIVGSKQTYGKGTVQNVFDLNQFVRNTSFGDLGALKTTTQKFYRINGGSTQLEGVHSDIAIPDRYAYVKMGERDIDNAMKFDKIDKADYKLWTKQNNFDNAIANSKKRVATNEAFKLIDENAKWIFDRSEENIYTLKLDAFQKEQKELELKAKKYKSLADYNNNLKFISLPYEDAVMAKDTILKEKRDRWHESLAKDIYMQEAINVLDDLQASETPKKSAQVADKRREKKVVGSK